MGEVRNSTNNLFSWTWITTNNGNISSWSTPLEWSYIAMKN
jgi:hypothetical protein